MLPWKSIPIPSQLERAGASSPYRGGPVAGVGALMAERPSAGTI